MFDCQVDGINEICKDDVRFVQPGQYSDHVGTRVGVPLREDAT